MSWLIIGGVRCVLLIKWAGQIIIGCITTQLISSICCFPPDDLGNLILSMFFYCFISSWNQKKKEKLFIENVACQMPLCRPATTNKIMWSETSAVDIAVLIIYK
jgi:hypothetical protein